MRCLEPVARRVVTLEPAAQAVEAGVEDALGHVRLIELVADLELERRGHDDALDELGVPREPGRRRNVGAREHREEGVLVDDPIVERRRLEEDHELLADRAELRERRRRARQHLGGEHEGLLFAEDALEARRKESMGRDVVDGPDDSVPIVLPRVLRDEVERHVRREGPVEQARRQAVVLREREPAPDRVVVAHLPARVLAERTEHRQLELRAAGPEPRQGRDELVVRAAYAPKDAARPMAPQRLVPGVGEEPLLELEP